MSVADPYPLPHCATLSGQFPLHPTFSPARATRLVAIGTVVTVRDSKPHQPPRAPPRGGAWLARAGGLRRRTGACQRG